LHGSIIHGMSLLQKTTLYIICGIPFSGKTTLAKKLVKVFGYTHIDLDDVKLNMFGKHTKDSDIHQDGWDRIYQEMYKRIETNLSNGRTVIHDTGNFTRHERSLVRKIADKLGIEAITVFVNTPKEIALERLLQNRKNHNRFDVTTEDFESTIDELEVPDDHEKHLIYKTDIPIDLWIKKYFN